MREEERIMRSELADALGRPIIATTDGWLLGTRAGVRASALPERERYLLEPDLRPVEWAAEIEPQESEPVVLAIPLAGAVLLIGESRWSWAIASRYLDPITSALCVSRLVYRVRIGGGLELHDARSGALVAYATAGGAVPRPVADVLRDALRRGELAGATP